MPLWHNIYTSVHFLLYFGLFFFIGRFFFLICKHLFDIYVDVYVYIYIGGLAAYFRANPMVKFINKTIISPQKMQTIEFLTTEKPKSNFFSFIGKE